MDCLWSLAIDHFRLLDPVLDGRPCLLAVAAPREAEAVLAGLGGVSGVSGGGRALPEPWTTLEIDDRLHLVVTGVGKANAAGGVAKALAGRYAGVLSLGLAGGLPAEPGGAAGLALGVGQVVLADACHLADEGLISPEGFVNQSGLGFPACEGFGERVPTDAKWREALAPLACRVGGCATVSTCSGTDARAIEIVRRTGACCEDMESAAVGLVAHRLGLPFACLRVISNQTGDRDRQGWEIDRAFSVVARLVGAL